MSILYSYALKCLKGIYIYVLIPCFKVRKVPSISIKDSSPGISSINVFHQLPQNAKSSQARKQGTQEPKY